MDELCDAWNEIKKYLIHKTQRIFCKEREIWWCSLGMNIGTEEYGKNKLFERPVLILKNYGIDRSLILPLSTKSRKGEDSIPITFNDKTSHVLLLQARTVSSKRFSRKIRRISVTEFTAIRKKFIKSILSDIN